MRELTGRDARVGRFRADLEDLGTVTGARLCVALSGGSDSLALLLLARAGYGAAVSAATVDHGLRAESAGEAAAVAAMCERIGIFHATLAVRVEAEGEGVQAAAREARYAALLDHCASAGIGILLTAHHRDDQAETILMRLARGAGVAGLAGVRRKGPGRAGCITLRPLLGWSRAALAEIAREAGLTPIADPSNDDPRFDRTHARRLLAATDWLDAARLADSAEHLAAAEAALAWTAGEAARSRVERDGATVRIDPAGLPPEILRRMLLHVLGEAGFVPDGPSLGRAIARLEGGRSASLGPLLLRPGDPWTLVPAPPRRCGGNAA